MKSIKTFVAVIALATSFGSFAAQSVTATGSTLESAEAKIAAQAEQAGASSIVERAPLRRFFCVCHYCFNNDINASYPVNSQMVSAGC